MTPMPDGRAFTEEQRTVDVDGQVLEAANPSKPHSKPKGPDIATRLQRLDSDLRRIVHAHTEAYRTWAHAGSPLRSPNYDSRRSGKPTSRTPPEAEGHTRMRLVVCAQRLAMSLRVLARHDWLDSDAWHPTSLQRHIVVMRDPLVELPAFKRNGDPDWRDAADVTVEPVNIEPGVAQLRGVVSALLSADWDKQDPFDRDTVRDMLHEAEAAVGAVKATGAWTISMPPPEPDRLCDQAGCWNEVKGRRGTTCAACVQRAYRERLKAR